MKIKTFEGSNIYEVVKKIENEIGEKYSIVAIDKYISWKLFIPVKRVKVTIGIKEDNNDSNDNNETTDNFKSIIIDQLKIRKKEFQKNFSKITEHNVDKNDNISENINNLKLGSSIDEKIKYIVSINSNIEKEKNIKNIIFFGTTGSGKSSLIGKLFINEKENFKNMALISADTYKIGSFEQIKSFCKFVDLPFQIAYSPEELESMLSLMLDYEIVAVDTISISPEVFDIIYPYFEIKDSFNLFVLDISKDIGYIESIFNKYESYIDGLAISKLDEATEENITKYETILTKKPIYIISYSQDITKGYTRLWQ